jgi:hypothetical protein
LAAPVLSDAQSRDTETLVALRAELARLEQAGYNPHLGNDPRYPDDLQAARAKIAAQDLAQRHQQLLGIWPITATIERLLRTPTASFTSLERK